MRRKISKIDIRMGDDVITEFSVKQEIPGERKVSGFFCAEIS